MERLTRQCRELDALLADNAIYDSGRKDELRDTLFERARASDQLESTEKEWLEIQEQLHSLDAS